MKWSVFCTVLFLVFASEVRSQNELFSKQYFLNNYLANPAVAGVFDYGDLRLGYRRQWMNVDGAPSSVYMSYHTNVSPYRDEVLRYSWRERRYKSSPGGIQQYQRHVKHGIGARMNYDRIHVFTNLGVVATYACHLPLSACWTASVGISGGVTWSDLDVTGLYQPDEGDPLLQKRPKESIPMVEAGVWVYSTAFYAGGAVCRILGNPYDAEDMSGTTDIYATVGYQWQVSDVFCVVPSVMYRATRYDSFIWDLNARCVFYDMVWLGLSFRDMQHTAIHAGVQLGLWADVNYTYDMKRRYLGASHEVSIGIKIWRKADECRNRWYFM